MAAAKRCGGLVHVQQMVRVGQQVAQGGLQVALRLVERDATLAQQAGQRFGDAQALGEAEAVAVIHRAQVPALAGERAFNQLEGSPCTGFSMGGA